jgi:Protein of unknown function (DUF3800)
MLTVKRNSRQNLPHARNHYQCGDDKACLHVGALFSGLPKALRDAGLLMVLQAWIDESGKGKGQGPVYLLAGYVGNKTMWEDFADDWQTELDREPKLPYLHARESQIFRGLTTEERTKRLLAFVAIIAKHRPLGTTFFIKHGDYQAFQKVLATHPTIRAAEKRTLSNPYYLAFVIMLTSMLLRQGKKRVETGVHELIEILFDDGMERKARLTLGFNNFIDTVKRRSPQFLDLLVNKQVETRDDKVFKPLQASDLLAWHLRRFGEETARSGADTYRDPVWLALREATEYEHFAYTEQQWLDLLYRIREETFHIMRTSTWSSR